MGQKQRKRLARIATPQQPSLWIRTSRTARRTILSWLPTVAIVLGTRVALAEAYHIPTGSMEPTLLVGDWLFVNKLRFGPHIPFTRLSLPGYASPKRNDVVVFESPPQVPEIRITPDDVTPTLVKRLVGLPGDTLMMRHGQLSINGVPSPAPAHNIVLPDSLGDAPQQLLEWQHSIEVTGTRFGAPVAAPSVHEWGPLVVPAGMYFMMGDNRDNSVDSRYYGPVPRANLRGTPTFVYYSYDGEEGIEFLRAVTEIRWSRLGTWIR